MDKFRQIYYPKVITDLFKTEIKMLRCKIFLRNFIHEVLKLLYPLIAIVIIQILTNTPRAIWEMLKNENCTCSSKVYICSYFSSHIIYLMCHLKENQKTFPSLYGICLQKRAKGSVMLQNGVG